MPSLDSDKAVRYISLLDAARCHGRWDEASELARKVEKHASHRRCLVDSARIEASLAQSLTTTPVAVPEVDVQPLASAVDSNPPELSEDAFEASICIGWVHILLNAPDRALTQMPSDIPSAYDQIPDRVRDARQWIQVSAIKGVYLVGQSHEKLSNLAAAATAYGSALRLLDPTETTTPEAQTWSLRLISRLCELSLQPDLTGFQPDASTMLGTFRRWAAFWATSLPISLNVSTTTPTPLSPVAGSDVWLAYYRTLTDLLSTGMACDPASAEFEPRIINRAECGSAEEYREARAKLRVELQNVGQNYERFLLETTSFPRAGERNEDVEKWVEAVMAYWRAEEESRSRSPDGGSIDMVAYSREVLQILYRAASKTFQSTTVLRYLFVVYSFLGEFQMAVKALETYIEVASRARERSSRNGIEDPSLDQDEACVWILSSGIQILTQFGDATAAEKAAKIGRTLLEWLESLNVSPQSRSFALKAIGASKSHRARWITDEVTRLELQERAITLFEESLSPELERQHDPDTLFEYGLLLGETGAISKAIKVVREGLLLSSDENSAVRTMKNIRLWYLFILLITASGDNDTALRSCNAVFNLLGTSNRATFSQIAGTHMDDREKEAVIELKMTHLTLLENSDNEGAVLEALNQLLVLFVDLFGSMPNITLSENGLSTTVPSSATASQVGGTVKSRSFRRPFSRREPLPQMAQDGTQHQHHHGTNLHNLLQHLSLNDTLHRSGRSSGRPRAFSSLRRNRGETSNGLASSQMDGAGGPTLPNGHGTINTETTAVISEMQLSQPPPPVPDIALPKESRSWMLEPASSPVLPTAAVERRKGCVLTRIWLFVSQVFVRAEMYNDAGGALDDAEALCKQLEADVLQQNSSAKALATNGAWLGSESIEELWAQFYTNLALLQAAQGQPFDAIDSFELALSRWPDYSAATTGLASILLDIAEEVIPLERPEQTPAELPKILANSLEVPNCAQILDISPSTATAAEGGVPQLASPSVEHIQVGSSEGACEADHVDVGSSLSPSSLQRIASRDRATGLLSSLTKRPTGWDSSDAWYLLGRASRASGDFVKAKEQFWWCVHLEEVKPLRPWSTIARRQQ